MGTLVEGIEALRLPCTIALLLPALGLVLASGFRAPGVVAGFIVGVGGLVWAQAAGYWPIAADGLAGVVAAVVLGTPALVVMWRGRLGHGLSSLAAVTAGAVIGWIWRPCVGDYLAAVLNDVPTAPVRTLVLMMVYVAGACLLAVVVAALPVAFPTLARWRDHRATTMAGGGTVLVIAVLIGVGLYDDLLAVLVRRSIV